MNFQRIDKIIATAFNISRSEARNIIRCGRVAVNGEVVKDPSFSADSESGEILCDGQAVAYKKYIYIVMNKPKGVLSACDDKNRQTVVDLLPQNLRRRGIAPVGRLDKDTTGLLLLTDDGQLAHKIISPKSNITKKYRVDLDGVIPENAVQEFERGITLADGSRCLPARLEIEGSHTATVEIMEGKYHQIKRMFGVLDLGVNELTRLKIGGLELPRDLKEGQCRELTQEERELVHKKLIY